VIIVGLGMNMCIVKSARGKNVYDFKRLPTPKKTVAARCISPAKT
jgi:hypothetical protein